MPTELDSQPCTLCAQPSVARYHDGCRARLETNLANLPGLYRQLAAVLIPGARHAGGGPVSGSKTAPLPGNDAALELRSRGGGDDERSIHGVLTWWERYVRTELAWTAPPFRGSVEQTVAGSAAFLIANAGWLCEQDSAGRFAHEVRSLVGRCRAALGDQRQERPIRVACTTPDCGGTLAFTLSSPGAQCGRCQTSYSGDQMRKLPLAARSTAAA